MTFHIHTMSVERHGKRRDKKSDKKKKISYIINHADYYWKLCRLAIMDENTSADTSSDEVEEDSRR